MSPIDLLLVITLTVIVPIASYVSFNRLLRRIREGAPVNRKEIYQSSTMSQWAMFVITIAAWVFQDRTFAALGFQVTVNTAFYVALALTVACFVLMAIELRKAMSPSAEDIADLRRQHPKLTFFFPRNGNELGRFYLLSITAGIVEETLWRGFMIWALSQVMPLWLAATISVIGFGVCHAYQGAANIPKVTLVGAVLTCLFLLTGSLLLPIILHAGIDIVSGRVVFEMMRNGDDEPNGESQQSVPTPT